MQPFVHLHVHSQYSVLDGLSSISKMVDKAIADGMPGMALTDHGNMMGIKEFFDYTNKVKGKAKDKKAALEAKKASVEAGTYAPDRQNKAQAADVGKSNGEILADCEKQLRKAQQALDFKPIFGCEMYCAHRGKEKKEGKKDMSGWHLIVLAKNEVGYHNLVHLVSRSWVDGFYFKPRTDHEDLAKYREGLVICSACLGGELPNLILNGEKKQAEESCKWFKETFGENYFLELQRHPVTNPNARANKETYPLQQEVNAVLMDFARKYNIKMVCTNDSHFLNEDDAEAHEVLVCMSTNHMLCEPHMLYSKQEWFKSTAEMNTLFNDVPEALQNTVDICKQIETYSIDHGPIMPNFAIPQEFGTEEDYRKKYTKKDLFDEFTRNENGKVICSEDEGKKKIKKLGGYDKLYRIKLEADYLEHLTYIGAKKRYGDPLPTETSERINFELHVMKTMGFPGYFLIVQDYINAARHKLGVSVGPGRGSAAGSAVAYCLGITQIDPIKYDLLFERFLNPDRISLPDIDVDFDDDGRGKVLQWVTNKYGPEKVAHIITYSTIATKTALKDVARVLGVPIPVSNSLCKIIPDHLPQDANGNEPKMNLKNAINSLPSLKFALESPAPDMLQSLLNARNHINEDPAETMRKLEKYGLALEGSLKSTGIHACGTIICRDDISDWVPISTANDPDFPDIKCALTQYDGHVIETTGLIKMDFLGLSTLSILREAVGNIRESLGIDVDLDNIPLDDKATYQLFCDGRTVGVFQFESAGMQKNLHELQPSVFEDLIAMNALYRPGPMQYIPKFIDRKHGREPITYDLDCMDKYLKETYGITVYQEQVMLMSREIASFTRGESDTLRKAMGKKQKDKLDHLYPKFIEGGVKNGHDKTILEKIWHDWEAFASYAFNKSHATCYSWIAYQTAYLKANYPAQYMAGIMSRELSDISQITKLMSDCKAMGINTLGPDINESHIKFSVNRSNSIRFGLGGLKGVGTKAMEAVINERNSNGPFKDIFDVVERVGFSDLNRKAIESLVLSGTFDSFGLRREQFFEVKPDGETFLDEIAHYGQDFQRDKNNNQATLFGSSDAAFAITRPEPPQSFHTWSDMERLNKERELTGIYLSAHPLDEYYIILNEVCTMQCSQLEKYTPDMVGSKETFGGMVTGKRDGMTKRNTPFSIINIEDYTGSGELALFGQDWSKYRNFFEDGSAVFIYGHIVQDPYNHERINLNIDQIDYLADVKNSLIHTLSISIPFNRIDANFTQALIDSIAGNDGPVDLNLSIFYKDAQAPVRLHTGDTKINVSRKLIDCLKETDGVKYKIN